MSPDIINFLGVMMSLGIVGVALYASIIAVNGVARRLKGRTEADINPEELEYLRDRADQVDLLAQRVAELETRLDFNERMLTESSRERHDTPAGSI
jgi:hypothetical protein